MLDPDQRVFVGGCVNRRSTNTTGGIHILHIAACFLVESGMVQTKVLVAGFAIHNREFFPGRVADFAHVPTGTLMRGSHAAILPQPGEV